MIDKDTEQVQKVDEYLKRKHPILDLSQPPLQVRFKDMHEEHLRAEKYFHSKYFQLRVTKVNEIGKTITVEQVQA